MFYSIQHLFIFFVCKKIELFWLKLF